MFSYQLFTPDGADLGAVSYAVMIRPGEKIIASDNQPFHVLNLLPLDEKDESLVVGLLEVEAA